MSPASGRPAGREQDAVITSRAEQDCPPGPVRLEISPPVRYSRARPYVDASPPTTPAQATFLVGTDQAPSEHPLAGGTAAEQEGPPPRPRRRYPLRRRGQRTREAKRSAYLDVADPRGRLAVATDYARSVTTIAEKWGMATDPTPEVAAAIRAATDALMAAGDALTAAMHTWSPDPSHQPHPTTTPGAAPPRSAPRRTAAARTSHTTTRAAVHPAPPQPAHHLAAGRSHQDHTTHPASHHTTRHTTASPHHPGPGEHTSRGGDR